MNYEEYRLKVYASVVDTKGKKQTFALREKPILIGRSSSAHITITDDLTSGTHCLINLIDDCVFVEDMKSKNGIFLNEIKVFKQRVYIDDKVRFGNTYLYLEPKKMDPEAIKALTPDTLRNRKEGELTLELETFKETKKKSNPNTNSKATTKNSLDENKLYAGLKDNKKKLSSGNSSEFKLTFLEKFSFLIDLFLNLVLFGVLFFTYKNVMPKSQLSLSNLTSGEGLYFLIGSLIVSFIFYKWNRGHKKGSIGERLCGLD
jgi:pSer/pThr/pTyr-binding forkhead associated (FHA) protein